MPCLSGHQKVPMQRHVHGLGCCTDRPVFVVWECGTLKQLNWDWSDQKDSANVSQTSKEGINFMSHDTSGKCFGSSVSFRHRSFWNLTHCGGIYLLLANYWKSSQNMSRLKTETFEGIHGWFVYLPKWNIALNHYPITTRVQRIF